MNCDCTRHRYPHTWRLRLWWRRLVGDAFGIVANVLYANAHRARRLSHRLYR